MIKPCTTAAAAAHACQPLLWRCADSNCCFQLEIMMEAATTSGEQQWLSAQRHNRRYTGACAAAVQRLSWAGCIDLLG